MQARRILRPGQAGTKKLLEQYGEKLICVRYRYDLQNKRRVKTVELIIEEAPWQPDSARIPKNKIMKVKTDFHETALHGRIKAAGGKWNGKKRVWEVPFQEVVNLGLESRILQEMN